MADYGTIAALAIAAHAAHLAERQAYADWMDHRIGLGGYKGVLAAYDAAALALHDGAEAYRVAAFATLETDLTGDDNDLVFTAIPSGAAGEDITVAYADPGEETAGETVTVTGTAVVVTLRSVSAVLSTGAQVKAALDADPNVAYLFTTAHADGNDGSGVVTAMSATALALA